MPFLSDEDFQALGQWGYDDGEQILARFFPSVVHLCQEFNQFPFFRDANRIRQSSHERLWEPGPEIRGDQGNLRGYQFFHPHDQHWYLFNYGGAGEIQFNLGMSANAEDSEWDFVRIGLGFSFGGSFIADKGILGEMKTPFFFRCFKELLEDNHDFRSEFRELLTTHQMICEYDEEWETPDEIIEQVLNLSENSLPGSDYEWVSFMHILNWHDSSDRADLMDMQRFIDRRCYPVFESCFPIWEAVQRETRSRFGEFL